MEKQQNHPAMTPAHLTEIQARADAATPGPWEADEYGDMIWAKNPYGHDMMRVADIRGWGHLTGCGACALPQAEAQKIQAANQTFIASCRADIIDLLNEVRRLTAERDAAVSDLTELANEIKGHNVECRYCGGNFEDTDQCNDDEPCFSWRGLCDDNAPEGGI